MESNPDRTLAPLKLAGGNEEEGIMFTSESDAVTYFEKILNPGIYMVLPIYIYSP